MRLYKSNGRESVWFVVHDIAARNGCNIASEIDIRLVLFLVIQSLYGYPPLHSDAEASTLPSLIWCLGSFWCGSPCARDELAAGFRHGQWKPSLRRAWGQRIRPKFCSSEQALFRYKSHFRRTSKTTMPDFIQLHKPGYFPDVKMFFRARRACSRAANSKKGFRPQPSGCCICLSPFLYGVVWEILIHCCKLSYNRLRHFAHLYIFDIFVLGA